MPDGWSIKWDISIGQVVSWMAVVLGAAFGFGVLWNRIDVVDARSKAAAQYQGRIIALESDLRHVNRSLDDIGRQIDRVHDRLDTRNSSPRTRGLDVPPPNVRDEE